MYLESDFFMKPGVGVYIRNENCAADPSKEAGCECPGLRMLSLVVFRALH